ncbi:MAG: PDZ domain-containing protein [Pseudomonadales bacterium]
MKTTKTRRRLLLGAVLMALLGWLPVSAWSAPEPPLPPDAEAEQELEARLNEARRKLDDAARQLAELNHKKYSSKHSGNPRKAMLGILIEDDGQRGSIRLSGITPGGGAAAAGLKTGDRISSVNGVDLGTKGRSPLGNLTHTMKSVDPGESVTVQYLRNKKTVDAVITTRAHQRDMMAIMNKLESDLDIDIDLEGLEAGLVAAAQGVAIGAAALASVDGMELSNSKVVTLNQTKPRLVEVDAALGSYFGVDSGVLIVNAPEDAGDVRNGDILLSLDNVPMTDLTIALATLADADDSTMPATVRRAGRERDIRFNAAAFNRGQRTVRTLRIETNGEDMEIIVEDDD